MSNRKAHLLKILAEELFSVSQSHRGVNKSIIVPIAPHRGQLWPFWVTDNSNMKKRKHLKWMSWDGEIRRSPQMTPWTAEALNSEFIFCYPMAQALLSFKTLLIVVLSLFQQETYWLINQRPCCCLMLLDPSSQNAYLKRRKSKTPNHYLMIYTCQLPKEHPPDVWGVNAAVSWDWDKRCYQDSIHQGLRREFWITSKFAASTPSPSPVATRFLSPHPHRDATRI